MELGKFPPALLENLLAKTSLDDLRVLVGPKIGEDAAIIDMGERLLVAKSDPVTFATDLIGWYAVQVNANDVACTGGVPKWFLATILVPENFSPVEAEGVFDQVLEACQALSVTLIGGHSEVTYGIDRPIIMGSMLGEVAREQLIRTSGAQEGDSIVITKGIAIEGTALLACDCAEALRQAGVDEEVISQASTLLTNPGISVITDSRVAVRSGQVHSLHDPTEGGLITGLRELAQASGLGLAIEADSVPGTASVSDYLSSPRLGPSGAAGIGHSVDYFIGG
ncbi:MAG TPA: AIR synthase related protein, partial [Dehalococcoidia bacterium]|nr:AIR synthase related protein [Dehalococcoidia bacterium]